MTLSTGPPLNFFGDHVFAWSGQKDLTAGVTTLLDFISPNRFYSVVTNVSFDYSGCSAGDVLGWIMTGNGETIYTAKWITLDRPGQSVTCRTSAIIERDVCDNAVETIW